MGPEWSAMGRNNHDRFIHKNLRLHDSSEFGADGHMIGFFIEIEGSLTQKLIKTEIRNAFYSKYRQGLCTFVIRQEEANLPVEEFKQVFAEKLVRASNKFASFLKTKIPNFEEQKFVQCVRDIADLYLATEISAELRDYEKRMDQFLDEKNRR